MQPTPAFERELRLAGPWYDHLCLWLQRPRGHAGVLGWPLLLLPGPEDWQWRPSDAPLAVFRRLTWQAEVPTDCITVRGVTSWASTHGDSTEIGISTTASQDGCDLARSLLVLRVPGAGGCSGVPEVPPVPRVSPLRRKSLVIGEAQVRALNEILHCELPLHNDPGYVRRLGYPDLIVPGELLILLHLHFAPSSPGQLEVWFQRPVPVGAALEWCSDASDPDLFAFRATGSGDVLAVLRASSATGLHDLATRCVASGG